jgi:hypothetical protein
MSTSAYFTDAAIERFNAFVERYRAPIVALAQLHYPQGGRGIVAVNIYDLEGGLQFNSKHFPAKYLTTDSPITDPKLAAVFAEYDPQAECVVVAHNGNDNGFIMARLPFADALSQTDPSSLN